jgi:ADP-ribosylglycohydrolase
MNSANSSVVKARATAALKLVYVADALSMPVHWFYYPQDIYSAFPQGIQQFEAAPKQHPHDFLVLPSAANPQIVGDVILKDKREYWGIPKQHVHQGMQAGENTLNAHCARLVTRTLIQRAGHYHAEAFLENYIAFMTADIAQHPDTYAEAYHRGFFAHLAQGVPPMHCGLAAASAASVGGLVTIAPIAIAELLQDRNLPRVQAMCREHLQLTHPDTTLANICDAYLALIAALLFRDEDEDAKVFIASAAHTSINLDLEQLCEKNLSDNEVIGARYEKSCGIENSWPSLLYLAYKYHAQPKAALLANTHVGGENCHRGSVLGVIMGLSCANGLDDFFEQLVDAKAIAQEIEGLVH